ncbi:AP-3 complex subunit mu [Spathaspora sp. JA1]|nr:AP-3 complex subunit mu [Spathaspora sp. JA1]
MIEALFIADSTNTLVHEYSNSLTSPKFKTILPKITANSAGITKKTSDIIPFDAHYHLLIHHESSLIFYVLYQSSKDVNPLFPLIFVRRLIETIRDYFGDLKTPTKIEANNDTLTLLLYQMLDDTIPYYTDFNKLRDLVAYKSLLSKFLSSASSTASKATAALKDTSSSSSNITLTKDEDSDIPWRRTNVRHTNNEMYVDVIETVSVILKPIAKRGGTQQFDSAFYSTNKGAASQDNYMISGTIDGEVNFVSRLTGVPLLQLFFNSLGVKDITFPSFHRCVNLETWKERKGLLSFIPPDGRSTLMKYQIDLDSQYMSNSQRMGVLKQSTIDVDLICRENSNEFEIKLHFGMQVTKVESITVEIFCEDSEDQVKLNRITHGDFGFKGNGKGEWNLRELKSGISPVFHGSIISASNHDDDDNNSNKEEIEVSPSPELKERKQKYTKPSYIRVHYMHKGSVPSGLKVDSLKIISAKGLGDTVKPYKGVKYITKSGNYIIRS